MLEHIKHSYLFRLISVSAVEVVGLSPIKGPRCFLEQETLPYCLVLVGSSVISQSN